MPSGKYLMEDFCYAGGLPAVMRELGEHGLLHTDALTVNGKTIWDNNKDAPQTDNRDVITPVREAVQERHAASRCCAATSRPTARSSSPRRRRRSC